MNNTVYGHPSDYLTTVEITDIHCPHCGREVRFYTPEKLSSWDARERYYKEVIGQLHERVTELQKLFAITPTPQPKMMLKDTPCCE